jgi:hypothetical protein
MLRLRRVAAALGLALLVAVFPDSASNAAVTNPSPGVESSDLGGGWVRTTADQYWGGWWSTQIVKVQKDLSNGHAVLPGYSIPDGWTGHYGVCFGAYDQPWLQPAFLVPAVFGSSDAWTHCDWLTGGESTGPVQLPDYDSDGDGWSDVVVTVNENCDPCDEPDHPAWDPSTALASGTGGSMNWSLAPKGGDSAFWVAPNTPDPTPSPTPTTPPPATSPDAPGTDSGVFVDPTTGALRVDENTGVALGVAAWLVAITLGLSTAWLVLP